MAIITFDHYRADLEYIDPAAGAKSMVIDFQAKSVSDAAEGVMRFFKGREMQIPEFFGRCVCVKIYPRTLGEIDDKGNLLTRMTMHLFEWKIDMGWTYEQRVDRAKELEDRINAGRSI